jgi:hypothetical protein
MHPTSSQREMNSDGFKMLSHEFSNIPKQKGRREVDSKREEKILEEQRR